MKTKLEQLKIMLAELGALYPDVTVEVHHMNYRGPLVNFHQVKTYEQGTEILRELGCGTREKAVWPEGEGGRCVLTGKSDGVEIQVFADGLPPTCRMETVIEKIPKQNTVDTGEFIEVQRLKVVCSETSSP